MKVLHLLGSVEDIGGILSVVRSLQSTAAGSDCTHVAWVNAGFCETRSPTLLRRPSRFLLDESPAPAALVVRAALAAFELCALLRREPYDVLHAHTRGSLPLAVAMAARRAPPVVFTCHGFVRRVAAYRLAFRCPGLSVVLLTPSMARHFNLDPGRQRLHLVSDCCADTFFGEPLVERASKEDPRRRRLVGLGTVIAEKNWHLVLDALARLHPDHRNRLEFHQWGATPDNADARAYARQLEAQVSSLGLARHCQFHGPAPDVPAVLRAADWFVLPSTREPCSVALIEGLAMGLPAVMSASGGNLDIIEEGRTGLLFEPDQSAALAGCLTRVASGEVPLAAPAEIRESVRSRSAAAVARQYLALYRSLTVATPIPT